MRKYINDFDGLEVGETYVDDQGDTRKVVYKDTERIAYILTTKAGGEYPYFTTRTRAMRELTNKWGIDEPDLYILAAATGCTSPTGDREGRESLRKTASFWKGSKLYRLVPVED